MFFSIFLIFVTAILSAKLWTRYKLALYFRSKYPIPPEHPVTGNLLYFPKDPPGIFTKIKEHHKNHGLNFVLLGMFYEPSLIISDPKDVEVLFTDYNTKSAKKAEDYDFLIPWLGAGLLISHGDKWFSRRKIITPAFHFNILEQFVEVFNAKSDILVKLLNKKSEKEDIDINKYATLFALDVICEASMGITINAQSQPDSEYVRAVKEMSVVLHKRFFSIIKGSEFLYSLTSDGQKSKKLLKILHKFTNDVISARRKLVLEEQNETNDSTKKLKRKMNFLDILLHATVSGEPLSNEDIREEVDTFMFEGHDTTTSAIAFTLYHLSQNQAIQEKVYAELKSVLNDKTSPISYQQLNDLKYLDLVIKESLRVTPPVPLIGRHLTGDVVLGAGLIPAGTNVTISIYNMNHNPEIFPEPEKFDPERFNVPLKYPLAYVPFSAGARNCIGQKFALLEIKTVISKLLLNYQLHPARNQSFLHLQADIVLKSHNGVNLQLSKRN